MTDKKNSRFSVKGVYENNAFSADNNEFGIPARSLNPRGSLAAEGPDSYLLSLRRLTREALPNINLYRDLQSVHRLPRPSLDELHNGSLGSFGQTKGAKHDVKDAEEDSEDGHGGHHVKFGWIQGVLILNIMNLWGPMLFLRTSWLVGQGGLIEAIVVILFSSVITTITALSTSAIATNGEVKGGGTYYMLSRSLGPEYGGAIGLIFAFANMVGVAMNLVGFCEAFSSLLNKWDLKIIDGGVNDARIIGTVMAFLCIVICVVGMEWEAKAQNLLFMILVASITNVIVGSFIPPDNQKQAMGITGWSASTAKENLLSSYRDGQWFFTIFSVYFPSATGILAGANISGELKDPQAAIPKGTLLAIMTTTSSYVVFAIISAFCVYREATGDISQFLNGTYRECTGNSSCTFGLLPSAEMLGYVSGTQWLVYGGNFAACVSSALACLVGAPRVFQALCRDKIYPYIYWFEKGYGKSDDPYRCYMLTFFIAVAFILIGDLNSIAPIMSNFFMAAFCLINFACFHASLAKSPGWRPAFRYWNMWVSLLGALLCFVVMFIMDYKTAIVTVLICVGLYMYIFYSKPDVNWGSSAQAESYRKALVSAQDLNQIEEHVKNYRPQILVLSGKPNSRPGLVDFSYYLTKGIGLMICGNIVKPQTKFKERRDLQAKGYQWLTERRCKAFYTILEDDSMEHGVKALSQISGLGKLKPNMLMMGYKTNWQVCEKQEIVEYFNIIHNAFDSYMAVAILRMPSGLDYSFFMDDPVLSGDMGSTPNLNRSESTDTLDMSSNTDLSKGPSVISLATVSEGISSDTITDLPNLKSDKKKAKKNKEKEQQEALKNLPREIREKVEWFHGRQIKGPIDVWWLYDDGGLTLLIPYLLQTRKNWAHCSLRVFSLANKNNQIDEEQRQLAALLAKFRINCQDVYVVPDILKPPRDATVKQWNAVIDKFKEKEGEEEDEDGVMISEVELLELKDKCKRYMRIHELVQDHSKNSTLVVLTLPMPRKNKVSTALYLAWLEIVSKDMPPFLFVRGNQANVLTFYS